MSHPKRNAPCPCGSGRKYKHCHGRPGAAEGGDEREGKSLHRVRDAAQEALRTWSKRHLSDEHVLRAVGVFSGALGMAIYGEEGEEVRGLFLAWLDQFSVPEGDPEVYPDPRTAVGGFLARGRPTPAVRRVLEVAAREPFTLWIAEEVGPGPWLRMRDYFGERRVRLYGPEMADWMRPGQGLMAQLVTIDGLTVLFAAGEEVVREEDIAHFEAFRKILGPHGEPPEELLEDILEIVSTYGAFLRDVLDLDDRHAPAGGGAFASAVPGMPTLTTTTGDLVEPVEQRYRLAAGTRDELVALLAAAPDFDVDDLGADGPAVPVSVVWFGTGNEALVGASIHGSLHVDPWGITAELMSQSRATAMRARLEDLAGDRLVFERAEALSLEEAMRRTSAEGGGEMPDPIDAADMPPEILEHLRERFMAWADEPVPALDGRTPREAAADPATRDRVVALVDEWEALSQGGIGLPGSDFAALRESLGLA